MADIDEQTSGSKDPVQAAARVLENLCELEPELKAAAIIGAEGQTVATTGSAGSWGESARELIEALDGVRGRDVDSAHLATDAAEIFMVREGGLALVAVTARFVLASLTSFDMRMALRDVARGGKDA
ncbi:MAG: hypothetical protein M3Y23_07600 [Actinomycetota bacterium]|nr:hypothetical protein [Actinomycetota bacterium]